MDSPIIDIKDDDFYVRARQDIYRARGFGKMLIELDAREHSAANAGRSIKQVDSVVSLDGPAATVVA